MPATRPLRIVHMAATPSGAPWMVAIIREQRRRGHDVSAVINGRDGTLGPIFDAEGIPYRVMNLDLPSSATLLHAALKLWRMARMLVELRADVVQYHLFPSIISGRLAAWLADAPLRYSMIPGTLYLEAPVLGDMEAGTAWADTKVIATCEMTRTLYVGHGVPREHVEVLYYGLDQEAFDPAKADSARVRREFGLAPEQSVVGMVAYFYGPLNNAYLTPPYLIGRGVKGHDVLLRAIPQVRAEFPDAKFVLVGSGWAAEGEAYRQKIVALAHELGVDDSVLFAGERGDIPDTLASFDVALQCSLCENLGGSIEALMMGRPLIVTKVGGLVDSVLHEKTGLLVPPGEPEPLAEAILRLLRDRALATRLGEEGRRWMLERFTLRRTAEDLDELYTRAIAEERLGSGAPRDHRYRPLVRFLRLFVLPFRVGPLVGQVLTMRFAHVTFAKVMKQGIYRFAPRRVRAFYQRRKGSATAESSEAVTP